MYLATSRDIKKMCWKMFKGCLVTLFLMRNKGTFCRTLLKTSAFFNQVVWEAEVFGKLIKKKTKVEEQLKKTWRTRCPVSIVSMIE